MTTSTSTRDRVTSDFTREKASRPLADRHRVRRLARRRKRGQGELRCVNSTVRALVSLRRRAAASGVQQRMGVIAKRNRPRHAAHTVILSDDTKLLSLRSAVDLGRARAAYRTAAVQTIRRRRQRERDTQCGIVRPACNASLMSARSSQHHAVVGTFVGTQRNSHFRLRRQMAVIHDSDQQTATMRRLENIGNAASLPLRKMDERRQSTPNVRRGRETIAS